MNMEMSKAVKLFRRVVLFMVVLFGSMIAAIAIAENYGTADSISQSIFVTLTSFGTAGVGIAFAYVSLCMWGTSPKDNCGKSHMKAWAIISIALLTIGVLGFGIYGYLVVIELAFGITPV